MKSRSSLVLYADNSYAEHTPLYVLHFAHHFFLLHTTTHIKAPHPLLTCLHSALLLRAPCPCFKDTGVKWNNMHFFPSHLIQHPGYVHAIYFARCQYLCPPKSYWVCAVSLMSLINTWRRVQDSTSMLLRTTRMRLCGDCAELPASRLPGRKLLQRDTVAECMGKCSPQTMIKDPKIVAWVTERPRIVSVIVQTQGANIAWPDIDPAKKEHSKNIWKCSHCMYFSEDVKPF